ncbi:hypothetical protein FQR65_LT03000 [Abscondita terminalis]|nr:hypothetical protein FQR65_LT03000 [Abscondita terminalis]
MGHYYQSKTKPCMSQKRKSLRRRLASTRQMKQNKEKKLVDETLAVPSSMSLETDQPTSSRIEENVNMVDAQVETNQNYDNGSSSENFFDMKKDMEKNVGLITPEKRRGEETLIHALPTTTTPAQIFLDINTDHVASIQSPQPSTSGFVRKRPLMNNTLHKRINLNSFQEEDEFESNDKIPLANLKSKETKSPFQELMPTPNVSVIKNKPRRKAIDYKGQRITKDIFNNREETKENEKSKIQKRKRLKPKIKNLKKKLRAVRDKGKAKKTKVSPDTDWYCHACKEGRLSDMRQYVRCMNWYHEECVGLTNTDKEIFF